MYYFITASLSYLEMSKIKQQLSRCYTVKPEKGRRIFGLGSSIQACTPKWPKLFPLGLRRDSPLDPRAKKLLLALVLKINSQFNHD
jgi:hypothetical protein